MSSEQMIKVPMDRIGVLVGKEGTVKAEIERRCGVELQIDGESGETRLSYSENALLEGGLYKALDVVTAIARGFSPARAYVLFDEGMGLTLIDLREYVGKSENGLKRVKSRVIGADGKARRLIEQLSGTQISIYGHTIAIIGDQENSKVAEDALVKLASGGTHKAAYNMLQKFRTKKKLEKMQLWESEIPAEERSS
jgi:ribosomal RNA assembly protein